jgi:hypothetical protein
MPKTTHIISVTQGVYGPVIDNFTIDLDDDLDVDEIDRLINEEAHRRLNERSSSQSLDD